MITYEVTVTVAPEIIADYERFMRDRHIPDLLATGCFHAATFSRSAPSRYRVRYEAKDQPSLDRYLAEHAPRLRAHVEEVFPGGLEISREVWTVLAAWPAGEGGAPRGT
jgi:hypothetical protein